MLVITLILVSTRVCAMSTDNMFRQVDLANSNLNTQHKLLFTHLDNETLDLARSVALDLAEEVSKNFDIDSVTYAKVLTNAAILDSLSGNESEALISLNKAVELIEAVNVYHAHLFRILMARAYIETTLKQFDVATETLRRAQHISHRQDGVYTRLQLPAVNNLAAIQLQQGFHERADLQQRFNLKVSEQAFGVNGEELLPTLEKLGAYFAMRGYSVSQYGTTENRMFRDQLFRQSVSLYNRSISIIEDKYGTDDLRLVKLLIGLSNARFKQGAPRNLTKEPMERALSIVSTHPSTDESDIAKSFVNLADTYIITSDHRAKEVYLQAWQVLADHPEYDELRYELFGKPKRLFPKRRIQPVLNRFPASVQPGHKLFMDLEYDVRSDGRVQNVRVIDSNIPNEQKRVFKGIISKMRFRPRIVDGELFETKGLSLHQIFRVVGQAPSVGISLNPSPIPR